MRKMLSKGDYDLVPRPFWLFGQHGPKRQKTLGRRLGRLRGMHSTKGTPTGSCAQINTDTNTSNATITGYLGSPCRSMWNFFVKQLSIIYVTSSPLEGSYLTSTVKSLCTRNFSNWLMSLTIIWSPSAFLQKLQHVENTQSQRNTIIFSRSWKNTLVARQVKDWVQDFILTFKACLLQNWT